MSGIKSSKSLVQQARQHDSKYYRVRENARRTARSLLDESPVIKSSICEATVHCPRGGRIWVASFTGGEGGQVWRSTGLTDRTQALLLARRWEKEARVQRILAGRPAARPKLRVRSRGQGLSQREVGLLLGISERAVRLVERRAFQKLFNHAGLRRIWSQYLAGELDEDQTNLTAEEISALFNLVRSAQEWLVLEKAIRLIRG